MHCCLQAAAPAASCTPWPTRQPHAMPTAAIDVRAWARLLCSPVGVVVPSCTDSRSPGVLSSVLMSVVFPRPLSPTTRTLMYFLRLRGAGARPGTSRLSGVQAMRGRGGAGQGAGRRPGGGRAVARSGARTRFCGGAGGPAPASPPPERWAGPWTPSSSGAALQGRGVPGWRVLPSAGRASCLRASAASSRSRRQHCVPLMLLRLAMSDTSPPSA